MLTTTPRFKLGQQVRVVNEREQIVRVGDVSLKREIGKTFRITFIETFYSGNSLVEIEGRCGERWNALRFDPVLYSPDEEYE